MDFGQLQNLTPTYVSLSIYSWGGPAGIGQMLGLMLCDWYRLCKHKYKIIANEVFS